MFGYSLLFIINYYVFYIQLNAAICRAHQTMQNVKTTEAKQKEPVSARLDLFEMETAVLVSQYAFTSE